MKRLFVLLIAILTVCNLSLAQELEENTILNDVFEQHKATGTLVIYDVKNNKYFVHNTARAKQEFYPASSFKIFNSLIGLEYGAVKNVDEVFYHYHGEKVFLDSWKADSNLRYAIKVSQVPAYQLLAHKIGMGNMQEGIAKLNYGNQEIGDKLDEFWLAGPLKISALQQADLLTKLAQNKLPFAVENQKQVADITVLSVNEQYVLHGKTGWATDNLPVQIGWFVGWLQTNDNIYSFAANIDINNPDKDLPLRQDIVLAGMQSLKIIDKI